MSNNEPNYEDNLFFDFRKVARVYVYCSNIAENYLMEYNSLEEAQNDESNWKDREAVIIGQAIEI